MRLEKFVGGVRIAEDEEVYLDLTNEQYADVFYALPQEPANLYMLLNGTVLTEADERAVLQFITEANGGVDEAMAKLTELVLALPPQEESAAEAKPAEPATPARVAEEPFEISVTPVGPATDGFANIPVPEAPGDLPAKVTGTDQTRKFERKIPPIEIQPAPDGKRVKIVVGPKSLDLGITRYEDLFYAMPGQNASIYRLINDTILNKSEERDLLRDMLALLGGVDAGMTALQVAIRKVEPPKVVKTVTTAPKVATAPPKPGTTPPKPGSAPPKPGSAPPKPGVAPAKPGPMVPKGVPGKPPVPSGPRPITVGSLDDVEVVDEVEVIPVVRAEDTGTPAKAALAPGAKPPVMPAKGPGPGVPAKGPGPQAPAKGPGPQAPGKGSAPAAPAKPAAQPLSPAQRKKKEIDRPDGSVVIKMTKEELERTGVKVKAIPNAGYQIICKEYFIQLSKAQYQELFYALPMPVMGMFKLMHNDLLKDPGSRSVLMKMIHLAGGPKDFMSALSLQVQAVKPTEDWQ